MSSHEDASSPVPPPPPPSPPPSYESLLSQIRYSPDGTLNIKGETILAAAAASVRHPDAETETHNLTSRDGGNYSSITIGNSPVLTTTTTTAAAAAAADPPVLFNLNSEQLHHFSVGIVRILSSPSIIIPLKMTAHAAGLATKAINTMFDGLAESLKGIDARNLPPPEGPFVPRLRAIQTEFRNTVRDSLETAAKIADYGFLFEMEVLKVATDASLNDSERLQCIDAFIAESTIISKETTALSERLAHINALFAAFTGTFSGWAVSREHSDTAELSQARKEMDSLQAELGRLQVGFNAAAATAAASMPLTGVLAVLAGPFAAFVIIGGLSAAAASTATMVGLSAKIASIKGDIASKQATINRLESEIQDIKTARTQLERLGTASLEVANSNFQLLEVVWTSAAADAVKIREWLVQGKRDVDMPLYMKISLDEAVSVYQKLAVFLATYISEVSNI